MELTSRQRSYLKSLGHHLQPIVQVGHQGVTPEVLTETAGALEAHELVKVRLGEHAPGERHELAEQLASGTGAALAQVIGRVALLYKAREKDPEIVLPR